MRDLRLLAWNVAVLLVIAAAGCSPERARYTVDEYRADTTLRHMQMARCQRDPGSLAKNPDCVNARQAAAIEDRVRLRDLPPVGLGAKPAPAEESKSDANRAEDAGDSPAPAR